MSAMGLRDRLLGPPRDVDLDVALDRLAKGGVLVDVRDEPLWRAGTAAGAANLPRRQLRKRISELPTDSTIVLVCADGRESGVVARLLARAGYEAVALRGGLRAWAAAGHPLLPGRAQLP